LKEKDTKSGMGWSMLIAMWVLIFLMLGWFFNKVLNQQRNPNQSVISQHLSDATIEVKLQRNRFGHYVTNGQINDTEVEFILDTGATGVVIPEQVAKQLKLNKGRAVTVHTANGRIQAFMSSLSQVAIGEIKLNDVKAMINPAEKSDVILLGMSFLKHIEFTQRGDTLVLRKYKN